ncbi:MAG: hypothetical protein AB7K35_03000 [Pseudorhodoplanes sp.]
MGKYEPLPQFLAQRETSRIRLEFKAIEKILGFKLPKSAYEYEAWWSNNETGHSHARAWLAAGWRTTDVDIASREVTFVRAASHQEAAGRNKADPWGCMAGTIKILPGTDLTAPSGEVWNAERGLPVND